MWDLQHVWQTTAGVSNDRSEAFLWLSSHWLTGSENEDTAVLPNVAICQPTQRNNTTKPASSDLRHFPPLLLGVLTRIFFNKCRCHIRTYLEETRTDLDGSGNFK